VHLMWSGEWGWEVSLAIVAPGPPVQGSHDASGGAVHRPDSLRATGAPKDVEINQ
jgi:hypothetical protein